jgi:hypothetical protein
VARPEERRIIVYFNDRLPAHPNHPICALAVAVPLVATAAQIGGTGVEVTGALRCVPSRLVRIAPLWKWMVRLSVAVG